MEGEEKKAAKKYLMCERREVYYALMLVAGAFGSYTYVLRGNVFCNAQTGNVVLMGIALGDGEWGTALYYLIPISAYMLGAFVSELLPNPIKHHLPVRWDTLLVGIEMLGVLFLGFIPLSAPVQIAQVTINFIASMQYNTFRQAEGMPMATTFVTNHIRQIGVGLAKKIRHHFLGDSEEREMREHVAMLFYFLAGAFIEAFLCHLAKERAIWAMLIPLGAVLFVLLYADIVSEKSMKERKPAGH